MPRIPTFRRERRAETSAARPQAQHFVLPSRAGGSTVRLVADVLGPRVPATAGAGRALASRVWWGATAALIIAALAVQVVVTVTNPPNGVGVPERMLRLVSYFTIQSNILVAATGLTLARRPDRDGDWWRVVRLAALVGSTVTGIVYLTVLRGTAVLHGWEVATDIVFHYVCPAVALLGWVLFGPRPRVGWRVVGLALLWPVGWLAYTLVHGAIRDWYPYPFIDVVGLGYARVAVNAVGVTVLMVAVAVAYRWLDRRLPPAPR